MRHSAYQVTLAGLFLVLVAVGCQVNTKNRDYATPVTATKNRDYATPVTTDESHSRSTYVTIQTDKAWYQYEYEPVRLVISNLTSADITIPVQESDHRGERTFRFYKKTPLGWKRLQPIPDQFVPPIAEEPGLVVPARTKVELDISQFLGAHSEKFGAPFTGTFIAQIRYIRSDQYELVQYSNEFAINDTIPVSRAEVIVSLTQPESLVFGLQNNSNRPIWLSDLCNNVPIAYGGDEGYTTLQRLTDEGTWEPLYGECTGGIPPALISPGQTMIIDGAKWFQKKLEHHPAGVYRWDVVLYLELDQGPPILRDVRHIYSEAFEYAK